MTEKKVCEKYKPKSIDYPFSVFLGSTKILNERVYLKGFSWDCGWYWGGGYLGNSRFHAHFDGCFLNKPDDWGHPLGNFYSPWTLLQKYLKGEDVQQISNGCSVWERLDFFLNNAPKHLIDNWWRIKDLYVQFYALKKAAEVFIYGGHCTSTGRNLGEIRQDLANQINEHIEVVIIPEIVKALGTEIVNR